MAELEKDSKRQRRKRVRGLLSSLKEQVEFYFGDANLQKDKFLQQEMKEHEGGFVPVKVIADFNRMKSLTSDTSLIIQAIKMSSLVELSDDQQLLRRKVPLPDISQDDIDQRTVYVEGLASQSTTDHNYVKKLFSAFGNVLYVSLPRHKTTNMIKGFAFIEFSSADEAQAAIEFFRTGTKPPPTPSGKETHTFSDLPKSPMAEGRSGDDDEAGDGKDGGKEGGGGVQNAGDGEEGRGKDSEETRREDGGEEAEGDVRERDKGGPGYLTQGGVEGDKQEMAPVEGSEIEMVREEESQDASLDTGTRKRTRRDSDGEEGEGVRKVARLESQSSEFPEGERRKKRNRQHKKRDKWAMLKTFKLRVMPKTEWLEMKVLYRQMQKEQMKLLKAQTRKEKNSSQTASRSFVSHCLLKVSCDEGEATADKLKELCSRYGEVACVDFIDGNTEGYVRFRNSGCSEKATEELSSEKLRLSTVGEEEERAYFLKTQAQRKQARKLKDNKTRSGQRGREKVVSRALQMSGGSGPEKKVPEHIRFTDSDNDST